jgi:pilus assembly protein CpaB
MFAATKSAVQILWRPNVGLALLAILAGGAGVWLADRHVTERIRAAESQLGARYQERSVVVASRNINAGERLQAADLAARPMPQTFLPDDAVGVESVGELLGRQLRVDVHRGTPVVSTVAMNPVAVLADHLKAGWRAITIPVDEINSLSGQIRPGDRVDLYYSQDKQDSAQVAVLLESALILAVGGSMDATAGADAAAVTLLASANDAARIVLAQRTGGINVVLRSADDLSPTRLAVRDSRFLLTAAAKSSRPSPSDDALELIVGQGPGQPPRVTLLRAGSAT